MNVSDIRRLDLNLLVTFQVVMSERNVTRAAVTLNLTQSAVSANIARLRRAFDDELFRRTRRGMEPTSRAYEIAPSVMEALSTISSILGQGPAFDPRTSQDSFELAMSDDIEAFLAPRMVAAVLDGGLGIKISIRQTNRHLWREVAADRSVDAILVGEPDDPVPAGYRVSTLFRSGYACVYDGSRLGIDSPISHHDFMRMNHVRVTFNRRRGLLDEHFAANGEERRVVATFTHFAGALTCLGTQNVLLVLPTHAAETFATTFGLSVSPIPVDLPRYPVVLISRIEREADVRQKWLSQFLVDLCD